MQMQMQYLCNMQYASGRSRTELERGVIPGCCTGQPDSVCIVLCQQTFIRNPTPLHPDLESITNLISPKPIQTSLAFVKVSQNALSTPSIQTSARTTTIPANISQNYPSSSSLPVPLCRPYSKTGRPQHPRRSRPSTFLLAPVDPETAAQEPRRPPATG